MTVFCLIYVSRTSTVLSDEQLTTLMTSAQAKNNHSHITGMLLMNGDYFFQLLEGEEETVRQLYARIQRDKRHQEVHLLFASALEKRHCPSWNMLLLVNKQPEFMQTQEKIDSLIALLTEDYSYKEQLLSDLFTRFMTPRQLEQFQPS